MGMSSKTNVALTHRYKNAIPVVTHSTGVSQGAASGAVKIKSRPNENWINPSDTSSTRNQAYIDAFQNKFSASCVNAMSNTADVGTNNPYINQSGRPRL